MTSRRGMGGHARAFAERPNPLERPEAAVLRDLAKFAEIREHIKDFTAKANGLGQGK